MHPFCVPSFLRPRLLMAGLALSALLAAGLATPAARAGSYTDVQTGGKTPATVTPAAEATYSSPGDAQAQGGKSPYGGNGPPTIQVSPGTLTDTFTWTHDNVQQDNTTDPPPACVLVEQDSSAEWYVTNE